MEHLLVSRILPYLAERLRLPGVIQLRVLKTVGVGESRIGELLSDFMERGANPTVGTLAHLGQVDIRIAAKAADVTAAERLIGPVEAEIRGRLADAVFGADEATLEGTVAARLRATHARLALAEVGGAGVASGRLAATASAEFAGGLVLTDAADAERLGLVAGPTGTPAQQAAALAVAVAKWAGASVGAALCLEPLPGTTPPLTSVGIAVAVDAQGEQREQRMGGDAVSIRLRAATLLLDLVRRTLSPGTP
jgi:nicotinamide-nucleotide amidase